MIVGLGFGHGHTEARNAPDHDPESDRCLQRGQGPGAAGLDPGSSGRGARPLSRCQAVRRQLLRIGALGLDRAPHQAILADDLLALSRGFDLPIGFFFTPPPPEFDAGLHAPDAGIKGLDPIVLLDAILGTPDNLHDWERELLAYSASTAPAPKSKRDRPNVSPSDLSERVTPLADQRARALLRRSFGDLAEARDVLERLTDLIDTLDDATQDGTADEALHAGSERDTGRRPAAGGLRGTSDDADRLPLQCSTGLEREGVPCQDDVSSEVSAGCRAADGRLATEPSTGAWRARRERSRPKVTLRVGCRVSSPTRRCGIWLDPSAGKTSLADYAADWLRGKVTIAPRTREIYDLQLRLHILAPIDDEIPPLGVLPLNELTPDLIRAWYAALVVQRGRSVAAKAYVRLRQILTQAVNDDRLAKNPCRIAGGGTEHPAEQRFIGLEELYALAAAVHDRYRAPVLTAGLAGLRQGELFALRRADVDLLHASVAVRRKRLRLSSGVVLEDLPKSEAGRRTVALPLSARGRTRSPPRDVCRL